MAYFYRLSHNLCAQPSPQHKLFAYVPAKLPGFQHCIKAGLQQAGSCLHPLSTLLNLVRLVCQRAVSIAVHGPVLCVMEAGARLPAALRAPTGTADAYTVQHMLWVAYHTHQRCCSRSQWLATGRWRSAASGVACCSGSWQRPQAAPPPVARQENSNQPETHQTHTVDKAR